MRILIFLHSFEPGGVERDALRLADAWAAAGHDVQIAMGRTTGALAKEAPPLNYTVFEKSGAKTAGFETSWMIAKLPALVRRLKPDIVFCAGNTYSVVAFALRLALGRACPPIVLKVSNDLTRRDLPAPARAIYHAWLRFQAPVFDAIVAMAEPVRSEIGAFMRVDPDHVHVINNASIRAAEASSLAAARDAMTRDRPGRHFLGVGRLAAQKNFALLIAAFAQMARPDDMLTIVGEGGQRAALETAALKLGVNRQVHMPGHVNPLDDYYARATAFVLSSDYEGLGVVVIEALAAGVPIVATDCAVVMPTLVAGAGLVVPIRDCDALAAAMDRIAMVSTDVAAMRARAASFAVEAVTAQWLALFAQIAR